MAKRKRKKQSRLADYLISFLVALVLGYGALVALRGLDKEIPFLESIFVVKDNIDWFLTKDLMYQFPVYSLSFALFILLIISTKKKDKGYKDAPDHGAYGSREFSDLDELREGGYIAPSENSLWSEKDPLITLACSEGIILGRVDDELVIVPPDSKLDNRNVCVVGSSGSAKGQAFVINNIINNRNSTLVVTDPKGELYEMTSDIKRDQGYQVYQVDFLNLKGSRYNPLDYVTNDIEALKVANTISLNSAKDIKQDFFFNTARDLLTGLIIYTKAEYENPNISRTVKGLYNKIAKNEKFLHGLCNQIGEDHPAYQYLEDAAVQTGNTRASILASFAQQTGVFSLQDVASLTEASDFNFRDLQDQKSILYVKIPVKDNPVPALTATFFDQLITTLYQVGDENHAKLKIPTIMLLDEFANLGKLNDYDNTLSTCRGYDLSIITVVQDLAQLEEKYSEKLARTIMNNHDTTLFLRTKDAETAKTFERLAGNTTIKFKTKSSSSGGGLAYFLGFTTANASQSTNEQIIQKPLISESELLNMNPPDKCYVFMAGHVTEMKKAYQSLIYKNFITGTEKKLVDGVMQFPYVYPKNRNSYIKTFNLKPIQKVDHVEKKKPVPIIKSDNPILQQPESMEIDTKMERAALSPQVQEEKSEEEREAALRAIVSDFFTKIDEQDKSAEQMDVPDEVDHSYKDMNIEETIEIGDNEEFSSDLSVLDMLVKAAIPERIEFSDYQAKDLDNLHDILDHLSLKAHADGVDQEKNKTEDKKQDTTGSDLSDELPF